MAAQYLGGDAAVGAAPAAPLPTTSLPFRVVHECVPRKAHARVRALSSRVPILRYQGQLLVDAASNKAREAAPGSTFMAEVRLVVASRVQWRAETPLDLAQGEYLDGSGQTAFVSNFRLHGGVGVLVLDAFFKKGDESKRGSFDGIKPKGKRAAGGSGGVEEEKGSAPPAAAEADHEDDEDDEDEDERKASGNAKAGDPNEENATDEGDNEIDQYAAQEATAARQLRGTAPFRDTQWCVSDERLFGVPRPTM